MERTAGNQLMVKENNQQFIIDTLIKKGAASRAELAKNLKLSAPSVLIIFNNCCGRRFY